MGTIGESVVKYNSVVFLKKVEKYKGPYFL